MQCSCTINWQNFHCCKVIHRSILAKTDMFDFISTFVSIDHKDLILVSTYFIKHASGYVDE